MTGVERASKLKLATANGHADRAKVGLLSSGVEIECTMREIVHPEGRFIREDGIRYDLCVMEVLVDPSLRPPSISRANFVGDRGDNLPNVIRIGNVRQSSFRLYLISSGQAFGTVAAAGKPAGNPVR